MCNNSYNSSYCENVYHDIEKFQLCSNFAAFQIYLLGELFISFINIEYGNNTIFRLIHISRNDIILYYIFVEKC